MIAGKLAVWFLKVANQVNAEQKNEFLDKGRIMSEREAVLATLDEYAAAYCTKDVDRQIGLSPV